MRESLPERKSAACCLGRTGSPAARAGAHLSVMSSAGDPARECRPWETPRQPCRPARVAYSPGQVEWMSPSGCSSGPGLVPGSAGQNVSRL